MERYIPTTEATQQEWQEHVAKQNTITGRALYGYKEAIRDVRLADKQKQDITLLDAAFNCGGGSAVTGTVVGALASVQHPEMFNEWLIKGFALGGISGALIAPAFLLLGSAMTVREKYKAGNK